MFFAGGHGASLGVGDCHLSHFDVHFGMAAKRLPKRRRHIASAQFLSGPLIQQRLELVEVVLIDERDPYLIALGQVAGTSEPGKSAADDHHVLPRIIAIHYRSSCH
jgi:hypothetical protein